MNDKSRAVDWVLIASKIFCMLAAALAAYILFKYVFVLTLPFLLGAALGGISSATARKLSKYTKASMRAVSFAVLLLILASFIAVIFFSGKRLITELGKLAESIASGDGRIAELFGEISDTVSKIANKIAELFGSQTGGEKMSEFLEGILGSILSSLASSLPGFLTGLVTSIPDLLLGLIVTVIASFYFALDGGKLRIGINSILPAPVGRMLGHIKKEAAVAAVGYLRSYSLILLITFAEIFFGLSVLGVEYSFLIAAVTAVVDILPILGVGIVLLPWALFCLITRDLFLGIGLIILYVITVIVRQYIEPKIVGESLGLHPLLALAAFYLGYRLFGFAGIIIAPLLLIIWRAVKAYTNINSEQT